MPLLFSENMNTNEFYEKLNKLFAEKELEKVDEFLDNSLRTVLQNGDDLLAITILNEIIGFNRDTGNFDKSLRACDEAISLLKRNHLEGSVEYATSLQNVANAYRAAGKKVESLGYYNIVFKIYREKLDENDYKFASLHNNIALLYQEMGNFLMATEHLKQALSIIEQISNSEIEVATTLSNLAASEIELNELDSAKGHLERALEIFRKDEEKNFHYSGALAAMASLMVKEGNTKEAIKLYDEALVEIEKNMGKESSAYKTVLENRLEIGGESNLKADKKAEKEVKKETKKENKEIKKEIRKLKKKEKKKIEKESEGILQETRSEIGSEVESIEADGLTGMEICKKFYEEVGKQMIHEKFPEYEDQMAVGLVGEGSEVFGYDDVFSRDHDFGPGFCIWLPKELYKAMGDEVQREYDKLPDTFMGIKRSSTEMGKGRVGVWRMGDFFEEYTNYRTAPLKAAEWVEIDDYKLATVTNGQVWRDDLGEFSKRRAGFLAQPPEAYRVKLARMISSMAQMGQANYPREMARKDYVTAEICIAKYMEDTLHCIFLLNDQYAPYYKWLLTGSKDLEILPEVGDMLRALADTPDQREFWKDYKYDSATINKNDQKVMIIEMVAKLVINELLEQGIIREKHSNFLGDYVHEVLMAPKAARLVKPKVKTRDEIIDEIVKLEFEAFDKVQNEGGRASCQDDWPTFNVMRKSQYMTWTDEMLKTLLALWKENKAKGWNMITEKYARMMESTAPLEYKELESNLPERSAKTRAIVDQIVDIQVGWMEDFAKEYPKLAGNARDITSANDTLSNTSYETYLRGELLTYSDDLIKMYGEFIIKLYRDGKNLAKMTIENTAKLEGFSSLEEAEASK